MIESAQKHGASVQDVNANTQNMSNMRDQRHAAREQFIYGNICPYIVHMYIYMYIIYVYIYICR